MSKNILFENKDLIGKLLLIFSFLVFIYMFIIPISTVYIHIDEYFTMNLVKSPFNMTAIQSDVHPPVYYFILIGFVNLLKVLSIPFDLFYSSKIVSIIPYGILLLFSCTKLKKDYSYLVAGLFTFSIASMGFFFLQFLTIRMYSWGLLFLVLAFSYLGDVYKKSSIKSWVLFTLFSILCIYTHNMLLISVGFMYILLFAHIYLMNVDNTKKKLLFKVWLCSAIVLFISYLPWIMVLISQMSGHSNGGTFALTQIWTNLIGYATMDSSFSIIPFIALLFLIFIIYVAINFYLKSKSRNKSVIITGLLTFLLTYILGMTILPLIFGPLTPRYLVPSYGLLWFSISILIGNLENYQIGKIKKETMLTISLVIILILGVSGFLMMISSADELYNEGHNEQLILEKMNNNNTIVIFTENFLAGDYRLYLNNSKIVKIKSDENVRNIIIKVLNANPNKEVFIVRKIQNKNDSNFGKNINSKQVFNRGPYNFYSIKINNNNTTI